MDSLTLGGHTAKLEGATPTALAVKKETAKSSQVPPHVLGGPQSKKIDCTKRTHKVRQNKTSADFN